MGTPLNGKILSTQITNVQVDQPPVENNVNDGPQQLDHPQGNNPPQDIGGGQQVIIPIRPRGPAQVNIEQRLMTYDTLLDKLGSDYKPKKDIKIGGLLLKKHSTTFKGIEQQMKAYETLLKEPFSQNPEQRNQQLGQLKNALNGINNAIDGYIDSRQNKTNRENVTAELDSLKSQISAERDLLEVVVDELELGGGGMQDRSINDLVQLKRFGLSVHDCNFDDFNDDNLDRDQTVEKWRGGNVNFTSKLVYDDNTTKIFKPLKPATTETGIDQVENKLGGSKDLPRSGVRNITACAVDRALGTNVLVPTEIGMHDGQPGLMMEEVHGVTCRTKTKGVADDHVRGLVEGYLEIRNDMTLEDLQNLVTAKDCRLDENGDAIRDENGNLLVFTEGPNDLQAALDTNFSPENWGELHQQLIGLQWLDALTAEHDRHADNFLISMVDGQIKVIGIDNDACFGVNDPQPIAGPVGGAASEHNTGLPDLIDRALFDRLNEPGFFENDILPELEGRLSNEEITGVLSRFDALVARANELDPDYIVDDWTTWQSPGGETVGTFLESRTESTSFWKHLATRIDT